MMDKAVRIRPVVRHTDSRFYPAPGTSSHTVGNTQALELETMARRSALRRGEGSVRMVTYHLLMRTVVSWRWSDNRPWDC